ncbi:Essential protein Yae1, N terminal [Parahypoxylon ruwenzoriense]
MHLLPTSSQDDDLHMQMGASHRGAAPTPAHPDPLDDVFRSDSDGEWATHEEPRNDDSAISLDVRRLRVQHTKEGYRDGITAGKAERIQAGFDEGFTVGAHVGLRAGRLLGLLEGIGAALRGGAPSDSDSACAERLLADGVRELGTESIFAEEYWTPDGNWKYHVEGPKDGGEVLPEDVAAEHPLIAKWDRLVDREVKRWRLDEAPPVLIIDSSHPEVGESPAGVSRQAVDW